MQQMQEEVVMKRLMVLILAVMLMAGVAYAKGLEVKQKAGDYNVEIRLDKNPPVVGNNGMEITITDASGRPVTDAKVLVNYSMPAMPGMPAAELQDHSGIDRGINMRLH